MKDPKLVRSCLIALREGSKLPVSVKCRLGVDNDDSYEFLHKFVEIVTNGGESESHFIVHARKVLLKGLSPI